MRSVVRLLRRGNAKLGESIFHFDLPAATTCPGRSPLCERLCYARRGRFNTVQTRKRLANNLRLSRRADFASLLLAEIRRLGVVLLRLHVSGDFFSSEYARAWLEVMRRCEGVRFYFYSRSWRVPSIEPILAQMAALSNCRAWYSVDSDTGLPQEVPPGVRLAHLQAEEDPPPQRANLIFRDRSVRHLTPLPLLCPAELGTHESEPTNCGSCGRCWM